MKKKIIGILLVLAMMLSLVACGANGDNAAEKKDDKTSETAQNDAAKDEEGTELEDSLVIYSTHPEELLEALSDEFTAQTGVNVEFINLKGELADRVRGEKDNPQADIMFGGDAATYMLLNDEGCYEETEPSWAADIDDVYKDANGCWFGTYRTPMVLFYNSEMLSAEDAPKDWADLADEKYKDKVVTRDTLSSSMRATMCALIEQKTASEGEDAAWDYVSALCDNTKGFYNSGSMMFQAVGKQEAAISMAVINDIMANRDDNDLPLEMVIPSSGAVVITDCIAQIKDCPHPNAASAFIEFVGSKDAQLLAANDFNRMPITDGFLSECPEWMQTEFTAIDVDWSDISKNQSQWLEKWETDYVDADKTVQSE